MTTAHPFPNVLNGERPQVTLFGLLVGVGLTLLHVPLAIAMRQSETVATIHAVVTVLVSVSVGLFSTRAVHVLGAMGYIAGAEVLWRMSKASVFWEFGKYSICLVLIIA